MRTASVVLTLLLTSVPGYTQPQTSNQIRGTVRDPAGLPMEGVAIVAADASARERRTTTIADGTFSLEGLAPGQYTLTATRDGFLRWTDALTLGPDPAIAVTIDMRPGYGETVIVTASRAQESLIGAPAAVTVIGRQYIETSAADHLGDLLRNVPGLNITQFGARDINISLRNATGVLSNSTLVMVDGRSVFQPFYGAVYWDLLSVTPDQLNQIEVLRTPATAMWGANALSGVINVRTKSPRQMKGLTGHAGFGERGTTTVGASWADASDRFSYKLAGSYFEQDAWDRDNRLPNGSPMPPTAIFENRGTKQPKFDVRLDWDGNPGRVWSIRGGLAGANGLLHTALGPIAFGSGSYASYMEVDYLSDRSDFKAYWNRLDAPFGIVLFGLDEDSTNNTFVAEGTRRFKLGDRHELVAGGSARLDQFDITVVPENRHRLDAAIFGEDKFRLSSRADLVMGARVDKFDTTSAVVSPRLGLVLRPTRGQAFRVAYNRAYRAPSLLENFVNFALPAVVPTTPPFLYYQMSLGSTDLEMERQDAFEIGYTTVIGSAVTVSGTVYDQRIKNNIWFLPVSFYGPGVPPPGWPFDPNAVPLLPHVYTFVNLGEVRDRGVELEANVERAGWTLQGSYTFQQEPRLEQDTGLPLQINRPARHKGGVGAAYVSGNWTFGGDLHFTDDAFWADVLTPEFWGSTNAYWSVNARASYRVAQSPWALWIAATDLFDERIQSHVYGDIVRRKVTAGVQWRWAPERRGATIDSASSGLR